MIISITGKPGSGKSSVATAIAKKFGLKRYYMGGLRREMARTRGLTLSEFNRLGETEAFTDKEVDDYQKKLGQTKDDFIIEGRTSYFLIPKSYKIFLDVSLAEGARRIWHDLKQDPVKRNEMLNPRNLNDVIKSVEDRMASDRKRYQKYYQQDVFDLSHYDYILDTTSIGKDEVIKKVIARIEKDVVTSKKANN